MTILISGQNSSGKSVFAEKLAHRLSCGGLYYIATMNPYGNEGLERVEKHKKQRERYGFITIEKPLQVSELRLEKDSAALLEDVSNLLGNMMFDGGQNDGSDGAFADITKLCEKCKCAVLVTISGIVSRPEYDRETLQYITALNRLNRLLFDYADAAAEVRGGRAVWLKGEAYVMD